MRPLSESDLAALFGKIRAYRVFFWVYAASAALYFFAVLGLGPQPQVTRLPLADLALGYGVACLAAVFLGRWLAFRPGALKAKGIKDLKAMSSYAFLTLAFLLAAGESMGMVAITAASLGAEPTWKLALLCLWQLAAGAVLTPDRAHWDRILTRWESTLTTGGDDEAP